MCIQVYVDGPHSVEELDTLDTSTIFVSGHWSISRYNIIKYFFAQMKLISDICLTMGCLSVSFSLNWNWNFSSKSSAWLLILFWTLSRVFLRSRQPKGIEAIMPHMLCLLHCHMKLQRYAEVSLAKFFLYTLTICDNFGVSNLLLISKINTRNFVLQ